MGPVAQPYDLYITVCNEPLVPPVTLDDTWLDGPVDVTGWCMKKPGNPVPVGVAAGVSRGVTVAGSLCGRAESAFCVWFSFSFVFWWQLLNLFAVFS